MVSRTFPAFDNEAFTIASGSPHGSTGDPIINNSNTPVGTIFEFTSGYTTQSIVLDDTSSTPDVFNDDQEENHVILDGGDLVDDGTEVELESYHYLQQVDDDGNTFGPVITVTVFSKGGSTSDVWGMATDTPLIDGARYEKIGGSNNGNSLYSTFAPCFTVGGMLATRDGLRPIETLNEGDQVITRDNGFQPVRWVGSRRLDGTELGRDDRLRPILIRAGALDGELPYRDVMVSPNHRMLIHGDGVAMATGNQEALVAAKHLLGRPGIEIAPVAEVEYVHILFDRHEVVSVDDCWSESFFPGDIGLTAIGAEQRDEVLRLFPTLANLGRNGYVLARPALRAHEAQVAFA